MAIGCHVSIHAPLLQGATLPDWDIVLGTTFISIHAPLWVRPGPRVEQYSPIFQSTHP